MPAAAPPPTDAFVAGSARPAAHRDGRWRSQDGSERAYRVTLTQGPPRAVVVMQQGTLGRPEDFDGLGSRLAQRGVLSYALGARSQAADGRLHADDLQALVARAREEHPGVPVVVMGVSLGAGIALDWRARHGQDGTPVVAMAPVVVPKYLGLRDLVGIAGAMLRSAWGDRPVASPMSAGRALTTNPLSPAFDLPADPKLAVPAALFAQLTQMTWRAWGQGGQSSGPLFLAQGGADAVTYHAPAKAFARLLRGPVEAQAFPGLGHDLSQEWHDPTWVRALGDWVLAQGLRARP